MVCVSVSVNLPFHHEVQKFSSGTGSPGWSRKKGRKMVVCVCVCVKQDRSRWYRDSAGNTTEENFSLSRIAAISKGIWAVKLCSNKILQFLTGGATGYRLSHIMAVKQQ